MPSSTHLSEAIPRFFHQPQGLGDLCQRLSSTNYARHILRTLLVLEYNSSSARAAVLLLDLLPRLQMFSAAPEMDVRGETQPPRR